MNCRRARKWVFKFVDGTTDEKMQLDLERHLADCPACEKLARSLASSLELVRRAPQETLDENFNWKVRLAIHKERSAQHERAASAGSLFRTWNLRFAASAAAGVAVTFAAGWLVVASGLISPMRDQGLAVETERGPTHALPAEKTELADETASPTQLPQPVLRDGLRGRPSGPAMGTVVSGGDRAPAGKTSRHGAIDDPAAASAAVLDSLIRAETVGMTVAERDRYLRAYLERVQALMQERDSTR